MPTFEITGPDGTLYEVDGPSEMGAVNAVRAFTKQETPVTASGLGQAAVGAVNRGAFSLPGMPGSLLALGERATGELARQTGGRLRTAYETGGQSWAAPAERAKREGLLPSPEAVLPHAEDTIKVGEALTGETYQPQNRAERYVSAAGEMLPAVAGGGAGIVAKSINTVAPAFSGELARESLAKTNLAGTGYDTALQLVATVLGGAGGAAVTRPNVVNRQLSEALTGVDDAALLRAAQIRERAAALPGGPVELTWPEAINQATQGAAPNLMRMQQAAETSRLGAPILAPAMARRPGEVEATGRAQMEAIAPNVLDPVETGLRTQRAAEAEVTGAQRAVNKVTEPLYARAERERIGVPALQQLETDPFFVRTLKEVRNRPELGAHVAHLPNDAVPVIELVQRRMGELAENARAPGQAHTSNIAASNIQGSRLGPRAAAEQATGGRYGDIGSARRQQETLRQNFLEPLVEGPVGQIAKTSDVAAQARALFPAAPQTANADAVIAQTVRRITRQEPEAARNLVRQHAESVFNEATQTNMGKPNQWGGAKTVSALIGNPQQARNLEAGVRALPGGNTIWEGLERWFEVMGATGQRLPAGSPTAEKLAMAKEQARGGAAREAGSLAMGAGLKLPERLKEAAERFFSGRANAEIARIITDPNALPIFRQLLNAQPGSASAQGLALRLSYMAGQMENQ